MTSVSMLPGFLFSSRIYQARAVLREFLFLILVDLLFLLHGRLPTIENIDSFDAQDCRGLVSFLLGASRRMIFLQTSLQ